MQHAVVFYWASTDMAVLRIGPAWVITWTLSNFSVDTVVPLMYTLIRSICETCVGVFRTSDESHLG